MKNLEIDKILQKCVDKKICINYMHVESGQTDALMGVLKEVNDEFLKFTRWNWCGEEQDVYLYTKNVILIYIEVFK